MPKNPVVWRLADQQTGQHAHAQVDTPQDQQQVRHPPQQVRVREVPDERRY